MDTDRWTHMKRWLILILVVTACTAPEAAPTTRTTTVVDLDPATCDALVGSEPWLIVHSVVYPGECVSAGVHQQIRIVNKGFDITTVTIDGRVKTIRSDGDLLLDALEVGSHSFDAEPYEMPVIVVADPPDSTFDLDQVTLGMTEERVRSDWPSMTLAEELDSPCREAWLAEDPYSPVFVFEASVLVGASVFYPADEQIGRSLEHCDHEATAAVPATPTTKAKPDDRFARPSWLGTRELELDAEGFGIIVPTPLELADRQLTTIDVLPPPAGSAFEFSVGQVSVDVLARSSWHSGCPVEVDELRYLTMSHMGFDGRPHTGEMIVNAQFAEQAVEVFRGLFEAGFPIEEMRVIRADELDLHPTGDGNVTTSFVCRDAVQTTSWSQHAFGLAIDVNPFHNPYLKVDLVLPELASAYLDRGDVRPGMIVSGDGVTASFFEMGWSWGGEWTSLKDWMHFSSNGR